MTEASWKMRALAAEALLEEERAEVERLRAYIRELEEKLPDEEGGEELSAPAPEKTAQQIMNEFLSTKMYPYQTQAMERIMRDAPQWVAIDFSEMEARLRRSKLEPPRDRDQWVTGPLGVKYRVQTIDHPSKMLMEIRHEAMVDGRTFARCHWNDVEYDVHWVKSFAREMLRPTGRAPNEVLDWLGAQIMTSMKEYVR